MPKTGAASPHPGSVRKTRSNEPLARLRPDETVRSPHDRAHEQCRVAVSQRELRPAVALAPINVILRANVEIRAGAQEGERLLDRQILRSIPPSSHPCGNAHLRTSPSR